MRALLGPVLFFYSALSFAAFPGKLDVYALLLASAKPDDVKIGARSIQQDQIKDPALLDLVAARLCLYVQGEDEQGMDESDNLDGVSWLAKALGSSGDAKYRPLLEQALKKTDRDKNKKYIGESLAMLPVASTAQGVMPSCPTLADFRAQALGGRTPAKLSLDAETGFKEKTPLDEVIQRLGAPTTARYIEYTIRRPFVGPLHFDDMQVSYLNGATILFDYDDGWKVAKVTPNAQDPAADPASPDAALLDGLLSGDKDVVSDTADGMQDKQYYPVEVLDAAARRIWRQRDMTGGDTLDALDDLCDFLANSHNPRYRTFLGTLVRQSQVKKVQKYAQEALDALPAGDAEQFQPPTH